MAIVRKLLCVLIACGVASFAHAVEKSSNKTETTTAATAVAAAIPGLQERVDTDLLIRWMNEKKYDYLDEYLEALYQHVKKNPQDEYRLIRYYVFLTDGDEDKKNVAVIESWLKARPDSYTAKLILASNLIDKAWKIRGSGYIKTVSEENYARFKEKLVEARQKLENLLRIKPDHTFALREYVYAHCSISTASCVEEMKRMLDEKAPRAYYPRRILMHFMTPRWGGSLEMIRAYQKEVEGRVAQNPFLRPLLGYDQYELCVNLTADNEREKAIATCEKAWSFGPDFQYLQRLEPLFRVENRFSEIRRHFEEFQQRFPLVSYGYLAKRYAGYMVYQGRKSVEKKDYKAAWDAFNEAQKLFPELASIYSERGKALVGSRRYEAAEKDLRQAVKLSPDDLSATEWLDYALEMQKRNSEMIPLWEAFIAKNPDKDRAYYQLAKAYHAQGNNREAVVRNAKKACELKNEKACAWHERLMQNSTSK